MEERKFNLQKSGKLSTSSSSMGNSGSLSHRGAEISPLRAYNDYSSVETRKMDQTTFRSSEELTRTATYVNPMHSGRIYKEIEHINRNNSSKKMTPKPPSQKPESSIRFEGAGRRQFKRGSGSKLSKSKSPIRSVGKRSSKTPTPNMNIQYLPTSPKNLSQPVSKLISKVSPMVRESRHSEGLIIPKDQADIIRQHKKSTPIALDKKYGQDKRIIFMPFESRDDTSGAVIFNDHGFIEFPKEEKPSKFVKNKTISAENYQIEALQALSFVKNFKKRKNFKKWRKEVKSALFVRKRHEFVRNFWGSQVIAMKEYVKIKEQINTFATIKESFLNEDWYRNSAEESYKNIINSVNKLMQKIGSGIKKTLDESLKTKFGDKLVYNKIVKILEEKKNSGGRRLRETKESKLSREKLLEIFLKLIYLKYQSGIVELVEDTYQGSLLLFCSSKRPKFALVLSIDDILTFVPDPEALTAKILESLEAFKQAIINHAIHDEINSNIFQAQMFNFEHILENNGILADTNKNIQQNFNKDIALAKKFISKFKSLEQIIPVKKQWITDIENKEINIGLFFQKNYKILAGYSSQLNELPFPSFKAGIFNIKTESLKTQMQGFMDSIKSLLKEKLPAIIVNEINDFKENIRTFSNLINERYSSISQISQHWKQISELKKVKLNELDNKKDFITESIKYLKKEGISETANVLKEDLSYDQKLFNNQINDIEKCYKDLRPALEEQLLENSYKLSKKIKKFESKYILHYLQDTQRISHASNTLKEIEKRGEALLSLKQKVELYVDYYISLQELNSGNPLSFQLQCRGDFDILHTLHKDTLNLWKIVIDWKSYTGKWMETNFSQLNVSKMLEDIKNINEKLKFDCYESLLFTKTAEKIIKSINEEINGFLCMSETLIELKSELLKPRHWEMIVNAIKKPHLLNISFKLQDLKDSNLDRYESKLKHIFEQAKEENKQTACLSMIKSLWESLELSTDIYKGRLDTFILTNIDQVESLIEEHLALIESIDKTIYSEYLQDDITELKEKLTLMSDVLETWTECQNSWKQLEPVFSSGYMQETMPNEYEAFKDLQTTLRSIMWSVHQAPKVLNQLLAPNKSTVLEDISSKICDLRKNIKAYLENKRANFPRFFFLSDAQLLQFLSLIYSQQEYDKHLSIIFPGVSKFYIKKLNSNKPIKDEEEEVDLDVAPFNCFSPAVNEIIDPFEFSIPENHEIINIENQETESKGNVQILQLEERDDYIVAKQRRLREKYGGSEVELGGMMPYEILGMVGHNGELLLFERAVGIHEGIEGWMGEVDHQMKDTLAKMISFAVATFPKQSLDEWVLDFPQQIIYTSILLILTHEITELMEDKDKENSSDSEVSIDKDDPIPEIYEDHFSKVYFGSSAQSHSLEPSKEDLMRYLQSKSYKGLYLRLQFWINQLIKSFQNDQIGGQKLVPVQIMSLRSLVYFLSYQRDIVGNLIEKKIYSTGDFEWQKLFRVYWKANESISKIECGGLHMIQGNEYLGTSYRLLCTPITTRYYVFISSVLRETSSVLFKTNPSHDYAGDVFEEFSNLCGMANKRIYISSDSKMQMLMQCLNGAALANVWIIFEHIDRLNHANLQVLTKEIQMVQQQFLIAEVGVESQQEDSMRAPKKDRQVIEPIPVPEAGSKTLIEKSGVGTYSYPSNEISDSVIKERPLLKYPNTMFVVMASLSPNHFQKDNALLSALQLSFRCMEMIRPDIKMISSVMLIREGFRYYQSLSVLIHKFTKNLIEKVDYLLAITRRDIMLLVLIAKKFRDICISECDLEQNEINSVIKACRMLFYQKITIQRSGNLILNKEQLNNSQEIIDCCVERTFKTEKFPDFEQNDLRKGLEKVIKEEGLTIQESQLQLCEDIYHGLRINRGVLILGPSMSGKSTSLSLLSSALKNLHKIEIKQHILNPNIFTFKQLFGALAVEKNIKGGILTKIMQIVSEKYEQETSWLVFDSKNIEPWWADSFIPILETSPLLYSDTITFETWEMLLTHISSIASRQDMISLPSMTQLIIPQNMSIIYTAENASSAPPSLFTRVSSLFVDNKSLEWEAIIVPRIKTISMKLIPYGITSEWILGFFIEKLKHLIDEADEQFKELSHWNSKNLMMGLIRNFEVFLRTGILEIFSPLEFEKNMNIYTEVEMNKLVNKEFIHKIPEINELKSRLETTIIHSFVWSFGAILNGENRKIFNKILFNSQKLLKLKYFYPQTLNAFESFIDFDNFNFLPIYEESSVYLNDLLPSNSIIIPSEEMAKAYYLLNTILSPTNYSPQSFLQHVQIVGPSSSGKTSLIKHFLHKNSDLFYSKHYTFNPSIKGYHYFDILLKKSNFCEKNSTMLIIEDVHLDDSNFTLERIKFWIENNGIYDPKKLSFVISEKINFITSTIQMNIQCSKNTTSIYIETPSDKIYKQILVSSISENADSADFSINNYIKPIASIYLNTKNYLQNNKYCGIDRIIENFKQFYYFSTISGNEAIEKEYISELIMHEIQRGFSDFVANDQEFNKNLVALINIKLRTEIKEEPYLFFDYTEKNSKEFNNKITVERLPIIQQKLAEKMKKLEKNFEENLNIMTPLYFQNSYTNFIWKICRILYLENTHSILCASPGNLSYECLQIAASLTDSRILKPQVKQLNDFQHFRYFFEQSLIQALECGQENPCIFLCDLQYLKSEEYIKLISWFITTDSWDINLFSKSFSKHISKREKENKFKNTKLQSKTSASIMSTIKRRFHIVFILPSNKDFDILSKDYPKLISCCEFIKFDKNNHEGFQKSESSININEIITDIMQMIENKFKILNDKNTMEKPLCDKNKYPDFLCQKRVLLLMEIFNEIASYIESFIDSVKDNLSQSIGKFDDLVLKYPEHSASLKETLKGLNQKLSIYEKFTSTLMTDSLILACNSVYLGIVSAEEKFDIWKALAELLQCKGLSIDECWRSNDKSKIKQKFKSFAKIFNKNLNDSDLCTLNALEALIASSLSKGLSILIDEHGEFDSILETNTKEKPIKIVSSSSSSDKLWKDGITVDIPIFLYDYSEINPEGDLESWKIGPGYTRDDPTYCILYEQNILNVSSFSKQIYLFKPRADMYLPSIFYSSSLFSWICTIDTKKCIEKLIEILMSHLHPDEYNIILKMKEEIENAKNQVGELKNKKIAEIERFEDKSDINLLVKILSEFNDMKELLKDKKSSCHNFLKKFEILKKHSEYILMIYLSLKQTGKITGDITYSWKTFKTIISMIVSKSMRDAILEANEQSIESSKESSQVVIDDDFFNREIMPAIFNAIKNGIPQMHSCLFSLIFALKIAVKRSVISDMDFALFGKFFAKNKISLTWMSILDKEVPTCDTWKEIYGALTTEILPSHPEIEDCILELNAKISQMKCNMKKVSSIFKTVLLNSDYKNLPVFSRILIAVHYQDFTLKSLLRQFIFEQLNSLFEYQEEFAKLSHFIKCASWSLPLALFSSPGMNVVNTICSLANYYGVGLEVIRTDPEMDQDNKGENSETVELVLRCATEGTWVLISTSKFPSFWNNVTEGLKYLRESSVISNTFRLFIDMQGLRHYDIPDQFLHDEAVRFYISKTNMEDLEGYNDIWSNLLLEDILKVESLARGESTLFPEDFELDFE
ncbi:unnamed protein product [Blepharisma stoltei]|uniref:Dynein heavy chain n=1 Tax=Blepharisma stoltei TaxID=1481888 RepID=A0AAU9J7X2_9CILI|nr:unnamed protein product [Blepharisma stoltei]